MKVVLLLDEEKFTFEENCESELLQQLQQEGASKYRLPKFPGGAEVLRLVLAQLANLPEDGNSKEGSPLKLLDVNPTSLGDFLEAACILRSPRFLRLLPVGQELRSSQALPLLEQVVRLSGEKHSDKMEEAFARVVALLGASLDTRDLRLGEMLAQGSLAVSLEVLHLRRQRQEALHLPGQPSPERNRSGSNSYPVQGDGRRSAFEWSEHKFAATVLQKHLQLESEAAAGAGRARVAPGPFRRSAAASEMGMESEEDGFTEATKVAAEEDIATTSASVDLVEDIDEDLMDSVPEVRIQRLAGLAEHLDPHATPPITAAAAVRALLGDKDAALRLFKDLFPRSKKLQWMVVTGEVPSDFLREVSGHPAASITLRRMLAGYQRGTATPEHICQLLEDLLFGQLIEEAHAYQLILKHRLTQKLVVWLYSGRGSSAPTSRQVAEALFKVGFIPQHGFLLHAEEGISPWDDGSLDAEMLSKVPKTEDSLSLARTVLVRHLLPLRRVDNISEEHPGFVHEIARLWPFGRWKECRDKEMIGEAFDFLARCWKALASLPGLGDLQRSSPKYPTHEGVLLVGSGSRRRAEELLLQMFSDLEVWRLPTMQLLTPWVPGQVLAAHVTSQCKELEDRQVSLVDETRENLEELSRLTAVVAQLNSDPRLEATDTRSTQCMQKQAEVNNTLSQLQSVSR